MKITLLLFSSSIWLYIMSRCATLWVAQANVILDAFHKTGEVPYKYSKAKRVASYSCCGFITCLPCILWSTVMRIIACPCMCMAKGPGFICSNNGCTDPTDKCISTYYNEVGSPFMLDAVPIPKDANEIRRVSAVLNRVTEMLLGTSVYNQQHYRMCDAIFGNTLENCSPVSVISYIQEQMQKLPHS